MNEALIIAKRTDILNQIDLNLQMLRNNILPAVGCEDFIIQYKVPDKMGSSLVIIWRCEHLDRTVSMTFVLSVTDTASNFINRIKAYLFDTLVLITTLE